jgi:hypothetical protein
MVGLKIIEIFGRFLAEIRQKVIFSQTVTATIGKRLYVF